MRMQIYYVNILNPFKSRFVVQYSTEKRELKRSSWILPDTK